MVDFDRRRPLSGETVDFNRRRPISGGISRGRKKKREKKRENLEIQHCSPNLDPLPVGFSVLRRENLQRSLGEGLMRGLLIEASQGDFFSLRRLLEEKTFLLPTWGEETSLRAKRQLISNK
ncbi:hypothetical protein B296_00053951 [Ensete ventricosum]|uniref:Uncharacterized protein n=1 Tax=Ensete ventricosum TaxID=4639 RepID=A0A426Y5T3_ENSVE|nr:hypothetical protein B296_00053951 [Ensete ventricosum]